MLKFKKKKSEIAFEMNTVGDQSNIEEIKVFKNGKYTHSVKIFVFPESIIDEIMEINGRKSIP